MKIEKFDKLINKNETIPLDVVKIIYVYLLCEECNRIKCKCCTKCKKIECECRSVIIDMCQEIDTKEIGEICFGCSFLILVILIPMFLLISMLLIDDTYLYISFGLIVILWCCKCSSCI